MNQTQNEKQREEIMGVFFDYRKQVVETRDDMNKSYLSYRTDNLLQRRELFKYIATISLGVAGLAPFIIEKSQHINYTIVSLVLHVFIIFLIIVYFRELLDQEGLALEGQQDRYNDFTDESIKLVDKYIEKRDFTIDGLKEFWKEIENSNWSRELNLETEGFKKNREVKNKNLDYFGEIIIFLFANSILFTVLGSVRFHPTIYELSFFVVLIFAMSFFSWALRFSKLISFVASFIKKNLSFAKKAQKS